MRPLLSLIVLGFKNFDVTTGVCLNSLRPWLGCADVEVLVIDNGSPDDSKQKTLEWCEAHPQVRCLLSDHNRGFGGGMNWGAESARGEWLLLVNSDTVFPIDAIDALRRVIQVVPPDVGMLGPVTNAAGNGQRLWRPDTSHEEWLDVGHNLHQHPSHQLMPTYRCDFFCIAIRQEVWHKLGGLDPAFGLGYYEDFEFSLRLRKAGYEQRITEDVFVLHVGSATFKASKSAKVLIKRNKKLLKSKHPDARFEHTRLGNLAVLQAYVNLKQAGQWTTALEQRWKLRIGALTGDAPRSFFKKWIWKKKISQFLEE